MIQYVVKVLSHKTPKASRQSAKETQHKKKTQIQLKSVIRIENRNKLK